MAGDTSRNKSDEASHPVVSMLRELDESFISQANLDGFMDFLTLTSSFYDENSDLNTMTKFIKRYVDFQVFVDSCSHNVEQRGTLFRTLDISDEKKKIFYKSLGQISFSNLVLSKEIKWTALKEQFYLETSPIFNKFDSTEKLNPMKVLRQVEGTQGSLWTFREKLVQAYLAAFYQVDKMLEAASSRVKKKLIGKKLTQSIKRMPLTFDMWLMTFGLALEHISLKSHLREIASEFFGIWKSSFIELSPQSTIKGRQWINKVSTSGNEVACSANDHLSCFFVELIYETSNVDNLVTFSNSILENESINYSGLNISKGRALYCLHAIGGFLAFCPIIYGIHLTDMNINEGNIKAILEPLIKIPVNDIQVLNLSNNSIGYKGTRVLFRFFVRASDLTHLDMSCCNLGDRGVSLIVQTFICMPLVYINLSSNEIGEFGSKLLSKNLCYVPSLEWLDLSNNNLGAGAVLLASVMSKLPCLRFLNLGSNKVDDEGAVALARLIEESPTMEEVVISRNIISGRGCRALAEKVIRSKSLKSLDVRNNKIPSSGVIKLRKAARSHGTLQVSTWEQNPSSDSGKRTEEGDTEMEQLLGRLDFQLSIAISKVSGGTLYAKVKEGMAHPTGVVITNPSYQNQTSPAVTPAMDSISIANGDDNQEIVSGESQSSLEESKGVTQHSDTRNSKTVDRKKATCKSSPIGIRSASTGKINFRRFVTLQRKSVSRICSKDVVSEMQNAEQKKAYSVYNKCFARFNSQKPSSDLC